MSAARQGGARRLRALRARCDRERLRRAGRPVEDRPRAPARSWAAVAAAIAVGAVLPNEARPWAVAGLLAIAATRPGPRGRRWRPGIRAWFWAGLAGALIIGAARGDAIERAAAPVTERPVARERVVLTEPLPAGTREHAVSAEGWLGGRRVVVVQPRFGPPTPALPRGAMPVVVGRLVPLGTRPGDARLRRAGVAGRVLSTDVRWDGVRRGGWLGVVDRFADRAQRLLTEALGARRGAVVAGMALGVADGIAEEDRQSLRTSGLWHLVAASGGNIALVVALVMALGWAVGAPDRWRLAASAAAICAYVPLAGGGPSIQRAGIMGLAGLLALALGREHRAADALALAAAGTLAVAPRAVLDVGWQLSFAAAAALIVAAPWASQRLAATGLPRWLAVGVACSAVATAATAPIMLLTFGELSLVGLIANLLVLPLVGVVVWSGAVAAVLTPVSPAIAALCAQPAGAAGGAILAIAGWSESRSFAVVGPTGAAVLVAAGLLLLVVRPPPLLLAAVAALALGVLVVATPTPPGEPRLVVFDIGQGNAALLQDGEEGVLVDAGPADGGLVAQLRRTGVRRLRAVVLSHPAADHDGGGAAVLAAFPTDLVLDGGEPGGGPTHAAAIRIARRRGVRIVPVRAGQQLAFGRVTLRARWPTPRAAGQPGDPNDRAAVIEAQVGSLRALLPADAEGNVLRTLHRLRAVVLVVSHHGSDDPALPVVLHRLRPELAVISLGADNTYGHPTASTLAALRTSGTPILRTDQAGGLDLRGDAAGHVRVRQFGQQ